MIYATDMHGNFFNDGKEHKRVPFYYMHGLLDDITGYDCCNMDLNSTINIIKSRIHLDKVILIDGSIKDVLVIDTTSNIFNKEGLIVSLDDAEGNIKYCLDNITFGKYSMYENDEDFIKENHPNVWKLIKDKIY